MKGVGYEVVDIMSSFHYACLVEAGDILYDAGDSTLHGEVAEIVAEYSIQSEARRSFLHHSMTVSYLLDMAIVFVIVSNGDTDTRLIFLVLEEMKKKFRDVDRPLHFEETLKSILKEYNVNLEDMSNEKVKKIRDRMAQMPTIQKETIEMAFPSKNSMNWAALPLLSLLTSLTLLFLSKSVIPLILKRSPSSSWSLLSALLFFLL